MTHEEFFQEAGKEAEKAVCLRAKCGSVIVLDNKIVGRGSNGPAGGEIKHRMCEVDLTDSPKPKSDRTCCVHAEWRAITDALRNHGNISGSTLYFTRVNQDGELLKSGEPYCTVCSRLALDNGITGFALWHENEMRIYDTKEYNELSYAFHLKK